MITVITITDSLVTILASEKKGGIVIGPGLNRESFRKDLGLKYNFMRILDDINQYEK